MHHSLPKFSILSILSILISLTFPAHAQAKLQTPDAQENMIMVLDASGSMWGKIDGKTKIDIAQETIANVLNNVPQERAIGLMAYGHREKNTCDDIELLISPEAGNSNAIQNAVNGISPKGKTPLSKAVKHAAEQLSYEDKPATVVLVTDGIETCNVDPCALANELEKTGTQFTAHVIGFGLSETEGKKVACLAENTGGKYLPVADASALTGALNTTVIAQAEPEATPKTSALASDMIFVDEFDGDALSSQWQVKNRNDERFLVEGGEVLLISAGTSGFRYNKSDNFLSVQDVNLKENWDMIVTVQVDFPTYEDSLWVGLWDSEKDFVGAQLYSYNSCGFSLWLGVVKRVKGVETRAYNPVQQKGCTGDSASQIQELNKDAVQLILSKRGRQYTATYVSGAGHSIGPDQITTDNVTLLRPKGIPTIALGQNSSSESETTAVLKRIEIRRMP